MLTFDDWLKSIVGTLNLPEWTEAHSQIAEMYAKAVLEQSGGGEVQHALFNIQASDPTPNCPHQEIVALYNQMLCPPLRKVKVWSGARQDMLRARWTEEPERQTVLWWKAYFAKVRASDFLMGRSPPSQGDYNRWRCDLEWLVRPGNLPKVIEGKYESEQKTVGGMREL